MILSKWWWPFRLLNLVRWQRLLLLNSMGFLEQQLSLEYKEILGWKNIPKMIANLDEKKEMLAFVNFSSAIEWTLMLNLWIFSSFPQCNWLPRTLHNWIGIDNIWKLKSYWTQKYLTLTLIFIKCLKKCSVALYGEWWRGWIM